jgi:glutathione S-transferase
MRLHSYRSSGNCLKVRLLLGLLEQPFELVETDIFAGETLTDAFTRLNPLRETPVLELDDGTTLTQSNAILQFLAEGTVWAGRTSQARAQAAAWCYFEQDRIVPGIGAVRFRLTTGRASREQLAPRLDLGAGALDLMEAHLRERQWLVGASPTFADIALYPYTSAAPDAGLPLDRWPSVGRWLDEMRALPGFVDDWEPYPANARPGAGRSIYD